MIVDDHQLVLEGIKSILRSYSHIEVIGSYTNGTQLLQALQSLRPDIVLMDLHLSGKPEGSELATLAKQLYPDLKIIVLTSNDNIYNIQLLLNAGADGYILKNLEMGQIVEAIDKVNSGSEYLSPEVKDLLIKHIRKHNHAGIESLTRRETEILKLIAEEYTSQEISEKLNLSNRTVETYRLGLMQKLQVKNMVGMVKKAITLGLIQ